MIRVRGRETFDPTTDRWARTDWWGVVLDARALGHFYAELLGWKVYKETDEDVLEGRRTR